MPSAIDPTRPQDGVSASKADLRAALQTIRTEVEHGGFFRHQAPGALESTTAATLGGMWVNVKTAFGAAGDGVTDDRAVLQTALDSGWPLYFPPGDYLISDSLLYGGPSVMIRGTFGKWAVSKPMSQIRGNFAKPLIHRNNVYIDHNNQVVVVADSFVGTGFVMEDMVISNEHARAVSICVHA